ncbi:siderophore biosynthesis protein [Klebsiella pneumoniae]|nr:siderophore biosynthesis protein [Klebsiella pneumoniae]
MSLLPPVYCFEPHQPEQCNWKPDVLLDITAVWEKKYQAIQCMQGQEHLWEYYTRVALQRGVQAKRNIGITAARDIVHGEAFQSIFPPRNGEPGMNLLNKKGLVIRHLPRHDEAVLRRCEAAGVATLHEAWDRQGLMGPAIRPIQQGVSRAGNAVTVLVTPGDNWMFHVAVEQCRAGDILVVAPTSPCGDGFFGDLLATSLQSRGVVGLVGDIGIRDSQTLREMGFAVWSRQVYAQGTVKESLGSVNVPVICAGQLVQPGDVVVADDDGVVVLPHARVRDVLHKAEARMSNELAKRERMRNGELGLDIYAMRPRLAEKGLRYYDRADEVEE